jgi:phosphatidate cytidylyltransferase
LSIIPLIIVLNFNYIDLEFSVLNIIFCLLISLTSQLGDLFISYIKRKAKIKDTGNLLPGHGGILDRVDGIIFAVPFSYFLLRLI